MIPMSFHLNLCFLTVFVGIAICSRCSPEDNPGITLELPTTIELRFKSFLWTIVMTLVTEYSESQLPTDDINNHLYLYIYALCFVVFIIIIIVYFVDISLFIFHKYYLYYYRDNFFLYNRIDRINNVSLYD